MARSAAFKVGLKTSRSLEVASRGRVHSELPYTYFVTIYTGAREQLADAPTVLHLLHALLGLSRAREALAAYEQLLGRPLLNPTTPTDKPDPRGSRGSRRDSASAGSRRSSASAGLRRDSTSVGARRESELGASGGSPRSSASGGVRRDSASAQARRESPSDQSRSRGDSGEASRSETSPQMLRLLVESEEMEPARKSPQGNPKASVSFSQPSSGLPASAGGGGVSEGANRDSGEISLELRAMGDGGPPLPARLQATPAYGPALARL